MSRFRRAATVVGALVSLPLLGMGAFVAWAHVEATHLSRRHIEVHDLAFSIPFPDSSTAEAAARGRHLVEARYACVECHGDDFGGGTMIDDPLVGRFFGPNLTTGAGSRTLSYSAADWDHIVRHGVKPDGSPAVMPSADFAGMSDRELSDIVSYIRTLPPVDRTMPAPEPGPLGDVLVATGQFRYSADLVPDHGAAHVVEPPGAGSPAFGAHLAQVCTGCHGPGLAGGPIPGGDPSWPPAANLTPGPDGLAGWTEADFRRALREGVAKDGRHLRSPMDGITRYGRAMTEAELDALWAYVSAVPAVADAG